MKQLISVWKKRPHTRKYDDQYGVTTQYKLYRDEVLAQIVIKEDGTSRTRHMKLKKSDPLLGG